MYIKSKPDRIYAIFCEKATNSLNCDISLLQMKHGGKRKTHYHQEVLIRENETNWSYERLFGRLLDNRVGRVLIEDPYIRAPHQINNFQILCELLVLR